jgi:hypothetical protein
MGSFIDAVNEDLFKKILKTYKFAFVRREAEKAGAHEVIAEGSPERMSAEGPASGCPWAQIQRNGELSHGARQDGVLRPPI